MQFVSYIKDRFLALVREEEAQDALEYLMVVAGISVVLVIAAAAIALGTPNVVQAVCDAVGTAFDPDVTLDCTP